jgi:hypothetical protein
MRCVRDHGGQRWRKKSRETQRLAGFPPRVGGGVFGTGGSGLALARRRALLGPSATGRGAGRVGICLCRRGAGLLRCPARQRSSPSRAFPLRFPIAAGQLAALGALRDAERREPNVLPDWIGDQIAGIGPEATRVFGRNAQIAAIQRTRGEVGPASNWPSRDARGSDILFPAKRHPYAVKIKDNN